MKKFLVGLIKTGAESFISEVTMQVGNAIGELIGNKLYPEWKKTDDEDSDEEDDKKKDEDEDKPK